MLIALKAIDWYLQSDSMTSVSQQQIYVPSPPNALDNPRGYIQTNSIDKGKCPLCQNIHQNPCASTGGYVFCYSCLTNAIRRTPKCPVTGIDCKMEDIIKLYQI